MPSWLDRTTQARCSARVGSVGVRTDDDNWDITTTVGATALLVATARALEAQKPDPLALDSFAEAFCRTVGGPSAAVLDGKLPEHALKSADWGQHFVNFQGARTRYFDDYFRRAADAGVRQVVIMAAGLDSRAYRLSWPDATTIFELDRPQVLDFKREVLSEQGATPHAERREVAIDLREDWPQALRDSGFDPTKPSAWIVEGLLIYLPVAAREQLFTGIDALASSGSHVAVEESAALPDEAFDAAVAGARAAGGERAPRAEGDDRLFFQLIYNEQHDPAQQWFDKHGWTAFATPLAEYLRDVGRPEAGPMIARNTLVRAVKK